MSHVLARKADRYRRFECRLDRATGRVEFVGGNAADWGREDGRLSRHDIDASCSSLDRINAHWAGFISNIQGGAPHVPQVTAEAFSLAMGG